MYHHIFDQLLYKSGLYSAVQVHRGSMWDSWSKKKLQVQFGGAFNSVKNSVYTYLALKPFLISQPTLLHRLFKRLLSSLFFHILQIVSEQYEIPRSLQL